LRLVPNLQELLGSASQTVGKRVREYRDTEQPEERILMDDFNRYVGLLHKGISSNDTEIRHKEKTADAQAALNILRTINKDRHNPTTEHYEALNKHSTLKTHMDEGYRVLRTSGILNI